ncbi:cytochrome P450 [Aspergillus aurantiobrunneus]
MANGAECLLDEQSDAPTMDIGRLGLALAGAVAAWALVLLVKHLYYRVWHPLSAFRGPSAAATSRHWIFRVTDGGFPEEDLEKLHEKYQTKALRIGPNELHITDVSLYKVIYNQSKPFLKYPTFYEGFNAPHTLFSELDEGVHKERRRLMNPLFSRASLLKVEPVMHAKMEAFMKKIERLQDTHTINVVDAFRCVTTEIIMEFAFSKSANMIEESETTFESWFLAVFDAAAQGLWRLHEWPIARKALAVLPMSVVTLFDPRLVNVPKLLEFAESCLQDYERHGNTTSHPVVFDNLSSVPYKVKVNEALNTLLAGADTTASTLTGGFLHILSNPGIHSKLVDVVRGADLSGDGRSGLQLPELEKIPYLVACVKESLRMAMSVPGRLPRIVPDDLAQPLVVDGQIIPPGTVVGMSAYTMHTSEEIWGPDARVFNPDRWLQPEAKSLEQYLVAFSKGARMCIGQNVSYAEITIIMAYLFRNFDIRLPEDFTPPERRDLFTMEYEKPGLPLKFSSVAAR